ncbi:peroxide stress protein YaaA [Marivirga atlantica]|jgi:cytoplasmic iron level regulating protein YaaA (DUF328/UPF0246 family)|uniref:UPF0246 protein JKP34_11690 n=1 Tax=Marivirga atlantica TaxID=1548457 RepID=A0A937DHH2_9BACT|nr:peroxide stress protein YaaA [Marivirga atlantica]MBL0765918.1 peroxide stress protein YaaA [Marivirga atlantica]
MIAILSPAKSLDFEKQFDLPSSKTRFNSDTNTLIDTLKEKSEKEIQNLMSISEKLAELNVERYHNFKKRTPKHAKQAALAFQGDVYQGMQAEEFTKEEHNFAQEHVRILSGLYGLLKPLDLIQPYRLEMGTKLKVNGSKSLYEYWDDKIAKTLVKDLKEQGDDILINLASNEYFKAVDRDLLKKKVTLIDVEFKDYSNGQYKIISFYAKKARGMMARYIVKNRIDKVEDLKSFDIEGYYFDPENSSEQQLCFKRDQN